MNKQKIYVITDIHPQDAFHGMDGIIGAKITDLKANTAARSIPTYFVGSARLLTPVEGILGNTYFFAIKFEEFSELPRAYIGEIGDEDAYHRIGKPLLGKDVEILTWSPMENGFATAIVRLDEPTRGFPRMLKFSHVKLYQHGYLLPEPIDLTHQKRKQS